MSRIELVVLGTSSQVPTRTRNHNAVFVFFGEQGILFDPGEGTQRQMTFAGIKTSQITNIAVTHFHGDHCLGLPGVIQRLSLDKVEHPVDVTFPASGRVFFDRLRHASIFFDGATIEPRPVSPAVKTERVLKDGSTKLLTRNLEHSVDCIGYRIQEADGWTVSPEKLSGTGVSGRLVGELKKNGSVVVEGKEIKIEDVATLKKGRSIAILMDTRPCQSAIELARDADLVLCEATYLENERKEAIERYHMTAKQAATLALQAGCKKLLLTHFSPRYKELDQFHVEASEIFENVEVAADLTRVVLQ